jgi:cytochrome P450
MGTNFAEVTWWWLSSGRRIGIRADSRIRTGSMTRRPSGSLSFGQGPHVCIGAALTLMEAEAVFAQVLQRLPELQLTDRPPRRNGNPVYRGLMELPVRVAGCNAA